MIRITSLALAVSLAGFAAPALAQQEGLVNVDIRNVANNLAQNLSVDVSNIPVTVQVPVGVAANVCGVNANVLAEQKNAGEASCTATSSSNALAQAVKRQLNQQ